MSLFSRFSIPSLPNLGLSDTEKALIQTLQAQSVATRVQMELDEAYYLGMQVVQNLRIAVPPELEFLQATLGWPAMAVDPYVGRLSLDCFRLANATDGDQHIADLMDENGFAAEQSMSFRDALVMGHSYWAVGSPLESGGAPQVTVESPQNMSVLWDIRGRDPRAVMWEYWSEGRRNAAVMVPGQTIQIAVNDAGEWVVADRDEHGFDFIPLVRMPHQASTTNRAGRSAITAPMRWVTNAACRTLLGLEVAREIYSVPGMLLLGAAEDAFVNTDGTPKAAWDTYITKVLALERDEEGNLPEIQQKKAYDPSVFTKLLDWYASAMAGMVLSPPQDMGLYTQGNPASADSVVAMNSERDLKAVQMQKEFGVSLVKVAQMALKFENKGVLPEEYKRLAADWNPVTLPTPGVTSDAVTKEIAAGSVPPTSDVVLKRLGYSQVQRARLEVDRKREAGRQAAKAIAESVMQPKPAESAPDGNAGI